jgi:hypothetical protein
MTVPAPYSYRQYAGNGTAKDFSVPFPYLEKAHVHVYLGFNLLDGTFTSELAETSGYSWTSGTVIRTVTAPATGTTLTVIRKTPNGQQLVEWKDGSNLISADLNTSDLQNLYVVQEQQDRNDAGIAVSLTAKTSGEAATAAAASATAAAASATSAATTATTAANNATTATATATSTANTASSNASAAVTTANSAATNASTALTTANTASTNASAAVTTANSATTAANTATSTANTALSTANTATSTANTALSTANTASTNASAAVTTANTASTNASAAVTTANSANTTANTASTNASAAVTTANAANTKADSAINAVASSVDYTPIVTVAGIPSTPANNTYIEIANSTGLQSFIPLAGMPSGFVGDAGLSVRLRYTTSPATWNWLNYYANNSDSRYLKQADTASLVLPSQSGNAGKALVTNGSDTSWSSIITSSAAVSANTGTSINFTGVPAWAKRITVNLVGVSTTAASDVNLIIRLGTAAAGISNSGYFSNASNQTSGITVVTQDYSGFLINRNGYTSSITGAIVFTLLNDGTYWIYVASGTYLLNSSNYIGYAAGSKLFTSAINQVRVTSVNGTNTFTGGSINILYEG